MKNLGQMMQKAQEVQQRMATLQEDLQNAEMTGQSGGGMVTVTLTGKGQAKAVKLDPKIVDPNDVSMLEDLLIAAINDAHTKVGAHVESETQKIMGGMMLPPGLKLPF
jgi:DNA-binding YbaB/EbfC family protein